jgi:hypothetical protein
MAYCIDADVSAAGGVGAGPFTAQIAEAKERIDRFCGDTFEPTLMSVVAVFGNDGVAPLPRRVQAVTGVTYVGASAPIDSSAWRLRSATLPGDVDAIELLYGYDDLIVGAERYNGGYLNLGRPGSRIQVDGTFGYAAVPATIKTACAKLAAWLTIKPAVQEDLGRGGLGVQSTSVEGYSVTYAPAGQLGMSTGNAEVDRLLEGQGYRRRSIA